EKWNQFDVQILPRYVTPQPWRTPTTSDQAMGPTLTKASGPVRSGAAALPCTHIDTLGICSASWAPAKCSGPALCGTAVEPCTHTDTFGTVTRSRAAASSSRAGRRPPPRGGPHERTRPGAGAG